MYNKINTKDRGMNMEDKKNNIKWIILGILMFCFTIIAVLLVTDKVYIVDNYVYGIISKCISPTMTSVVKKITELANPITLMVIVLVVCYILLVKQKDKKTALAFCLNIAIIAILNFVLKNIFVRTRPEYINLITETGYSFPSGHSALSMAFYGYIIYIINTKCSNKPLKIISSIFLGIVILLVGTSRIYLGVHFASDVLAAFMLSLSYLIVYTHILKSIEGKSIIKNK